MAIKILSPVSTTSGLTISNLIATYSGRYIFRTVTINGEKKYEISSNISYYVDRSLQQVFDEPVKLVIPLELSNNAWQELYDYLKHKYPSYQDLL